MTSSRLVSMASSPSQRVSFGGWRKAVATSRQGCLGHSIAAAGWLLALWMTATEPAAAGSSETPGLIVLAGRNVKWGTAEYGTGAAVSYALLDQARSFADARNCGEMLPLRSLTKRSLVSMESLRAAVREATAVWSRVAPVLFREIDDPDRADILIGAQDGSRGIAWTNVDRVPGKGRIAALTRASICLDPSERWSAGWDGDVDTYDLPRVLTHELGHAIGLDHIGRSGGIMGFAYVEEPRLTLSAADIAAVTRLYGQRAGTVEAASGGTAIPAAGVGIAACATADGSLAGCGLTPDVRTSPAPTGSRHP